MGLYERMRGMFGARPAALVSEAQIRDFLRSNSTASGVSITEDSAMRVAAAWRCVNIISGSIATLPLDLIRRVDEERRAPAIGHQLRRLLTVKPNHWQTPSEFRRMMQSHLLLRGNAYARKVTLGQSIVAILPIHPDRVEAEQIDTMEMVYKVRGKDGRMGTTLSQREMLHLRGMSLDGVTGISVLSNMREALGLALQTERAGARLFKDGVLAGGFISHPKTLSVGAQERLHSSLDNKYAGVENAAKWMILEEGMKPEPLAFSAEDTQWISARDFQRYDIAMFFGVPPHMIGATEKTTSWGTGIEAQGTAFVTYTLADWIKTWEESLKRDCLPENEWDTLDIRFNVNGLQRGDWKGRWEGYVKALQWGVASPNEIRAMEDWNPRDGGDVYYPPPNTSGTPEGSTNEPEDPAKDQRP
jgi:HK97 family phage portal protein